MENLDVNESLDSELTYVDKANRYIDDVLSGKIPACQEVKLACTRQLNDLKQAEEESFRFYFDEGAANRICQFAELMVHVKGKWAGSFIHLEDWQCFCLTTIFGWLDKETKYRRFTEFYLKIPRKNGKSIIFGAVIGLYLAFMDDESGAEVYSGATTEKQALEVFRPAWLMVSRNEQFRTRLGLELGGTAANPKSVYRISDGSRFETVVGEPGDGASPNGAIVDEYHQHRTAILYDTMKTGMGARMQPINGVVTTAGIDTSSPCYEHEQRMKSILEGNIFNERIFVCMYGIDENDDWKDFSVWRKANPNYGISVMEQYLEQQYQEACQSASKQNILLTKHLNKWMNAGHAWMNMLKWQACAVDRMDITEFAGCKAYISLDLASKIDIADLVCVLQPTPGGPWITFSEAFLPSETVELAQNEHYRRWQAEGYLTVTDGARTDFTVIEERIKEWSSILNIQELAFDPREASMLIQRIMLWANFPCIEVTQSVTQISEPMKEVEGMIYARQLLHFDDPVFNWMMGNVIVKRASGGGPIKYYYPTKERESAKIDGPVALMMAMKRALATDGEYVSQGFVDTFDEEEEEFAEQSAIQYTVDYPEDIIIL